MREVEAGRESRQDRAKVPVREKIAEGAGEGGGEGPSSR